MLVGAPEPVYTPDRDEEIRPALLIRVDPELIQAWPGDERVLSAGEFLRLWGWRIMSDPAAGGILDLFAWGLRVEDVPAGHDLIGLRRPGGFLWEGRVPLPGDWLSKVVERKGRLVPCFAVPDSPSAEAPGLLADRVRKPANEEMLLGARMELREGTP